MSNERIKIALYSLQLSETDLIFLADLVLELERIGYTLSVEAEFASSLAPHLPNTHFTVFTSAAELKKMKADLMLSIGGDGTMLRAATFIGDSELPLIGVI